MFVGGSLVTRQTSFISCDAFSEPATLLWPLVFPTLLPVDPSLDRSRRPRFVARCFHFPAVVCTAAWPRRRTSKSVWYPRQPPLKTLFLCCRDDVASNSTFTLEDSAICLTSEQSTVDVDMDRDDGSVLDIYLVRGFSVFQPFSTNKKKRQSKLSFLSLLPCSEERPRHLHFPPANMRQSLHQMGPTVLLKSTSSAARSILPLLLPTPKKKKKKKDWIILRVDKRRYTNTWRRRGDGHGGTRSGPGRWRRADLRSVPQSVPSSFIRV